MRAAAFGIRVSKQHMQRLTQQHGARIVLGPRTRLSRPRCQHLIGKRERSIRLADADPRNVILIRYKKAQDDFVGVEFGLRMLQFRKHHIECSAHVFSENGRKVIRQFSEVDVVNFLQRRSGFL